jgi:sterol desaturase/sphingolipid hydroxylase (fatty acid hydroxylase superfamily)
MPARLIFFVVCLLIFALIENRPAHFVKRLVLHLSLILIGSACAAVIPFNYFYSAGLLSLVPLPEIIKTVLSLVVLDFALYWQHRWFHSIHLFWRMHAVHHSDQAMDVTTGFRFHPAEIFVSTLFKGGFVFCLGVSPFAFLLFQVWLSTGALFTHAAIRLPQKLANVVELLIVTPNMHGIHHLTDETMQHKNFGFGLSIWDRLFNSYVHSSALPQTPHYGLSSHPEEDSFSQLMLLPTKL